MPTRLPHTDAGRFAKRMREAMSDKGMPERGRQVFLVNLLKVAGPTAKGYYDGLYMPDEAKTSILAAALEVEYAWLRFGKGQKHGAEVAVDVVPFFRDARVSGGHGAHGGDFDSAGGLAFRPGSLQRQGLSVDRCEAIPVTGDSMSPTIKDGDAVLYNRAETQPRAGKIYVINLPDEGGVVKRLFLENGMLRVASDNPDKQYQDRFFDPDTEQVQVLGRVRWIGRWEN